MNLQQFTTRFHQLCSLESPTEADITEAKQVAQALIGLLPSNAAEVVMTKELILGRIDRMETWFKIEHPTAEDQETSRQAGYEFQLSFMPDVGVRH